VLLHISGSQNKVQILVLHHNLHKSCTYSTNESGVVWEGQLTCSRPRYQSVEVPKPEPSRLGSWVPVLAAKLSSGLEILKFLDLKKKKSVFFKSPLLDKLKLVYIALCRCTSLP